MTIDLYYTMASGPCRMVMLVAAALDIHLNLKEVNLGAGEQLQPDFLKLNPQHTVPTMVDGNFVLWESRAISKYLADKYGGESSLYPKDLQLRALVDQRLDFDLGTLNTRFAQYFYPQFFGGPSPSEAQLKEVQEALGFLNSFLEGNKYAVGDQLTLADLSLVATISTIETAGTSLEEYPNIVRWYELVKSTAPSYKEVNGKGIVEMKKFLAQFTAKTEL